MKFVARKSDLQSAISLAQRAVSSRTTLPILSNMLLEADESITLSATDLDIGIIAPCEGEVEIEGRVTVPSKLFAEVVGAQSGELVEVSLEDEQLVIRSSGSHMELHTLPADEYPVIPPIGDASTIVCEAAQLRDALGKVLPSASTDETRARLTGVHLITDNGVRLVATDTHRLATCRFDLDVPDMLDAIIPGRALKEVLSLSGVITISISDTQVLFSGDNGTLQSRRIEGEFPDWKKVDTIKGAWAIEAETASVKDSLRRCNIVARNDNRKVFVRITPDGEMSLKSSSLRVGKSDETVLCQVTTEETEFEAAFNADYFLQGLAHVGERVTIFFDAANKPAKIVDGTYVYLLMPMMKD